MGYNPTSKTFLGYSSSIQPGAQKKYLTYAPVLGHSFVQQVPRLNCTETQRNRGAHRINAQASVVLTFKYVCATCVASALASKRSKNTYVQCLSTEDFPHVVTEEGNFASKQRQRYHSDRPVVSRPTMARVAHHNLGSSNVQGGHGLAVRMYKGMGTMSRTEIGYL